MVAAVVVEVDQAVAVATPEHRARPLAAPLELREPEHSEEIARQARALVVLEAMAAPLPEIPAQGAAAAPRPVMAAEVVAAAVELEKPRPANPLHRAALLVPEGKAS